MRFADRRHAGEKLGQVAAELEPADPLVAALPRGGVPVGFEVSRALDCQLDVLVVRKVGVPYQPELAMGAVAEGGVVIRNEDVLSAARISATEFDSAVDLARRELNQRLAAYRAAVDPIDPAERTVIVVDDGLATGSTAMAALAAVRARGANQVWLAVPVAPGEMVSQMTSHADEVIVLHHPRRFVAVGAWYQDFSQTSDDQVRDLLRRSRD